MAFSGIGKLIKDLVTGTPADTDYFAFGNTDLKKVSFLNLKKALGIDALNSALETRSFAGVEVAARSYKDVTFTYTKTHAIVPTVVASLTGKADTLHRASINLSVFGKTKTGFGIRIYNNSDALVNVELNWIAMEA